jgi:tetratricopeptide (TPR) repeat protein
MQSEKEFPLFLVILIPLLFGISISLAPRPQPLQDEFIAVQNAGTSQNPTGVVRHMLGILAWEPWRTNLWAAAGSNAVSAQDFSAAVSYFQKASSLGTLSDPGREEMGDAYLQSGQWSSAVLTWLELVNEGQANDALFEKIVNAQWSHQAYSAALQTAQKWLLYSPQNAKASFQAGLLQCVIDPTKAGAYLDRADALDQSLSAQVDFLQNALATALKQTHDGYRRVVVGRALASQGHWDLAMQSFDAATRSTPDYAEGWAFLAEARQQLDLDGSQALKQAQALDPNSIIVQAMLALWNRRNGHPEAAITQLEQIAAQEPDKAVWQIELGNTTAAIGDLNGAMKYFQKATALEPSNSQTWFVLGDFCAVHSIATREIGLPAARQFLLLTSESASALDLMGREMQALEDMKSAERFLQQAIEKDAGYAAAHLHLAQLYLQQNQMAQAYPFLAEALKTAGNDTETGLLAKRLLNQYFGVQ